MAFWSCATLSSLARGLSWGMAEDAIKTLSGHIQLQEPHYKDDPSIDNSFSIKSVDPELFRRREVVGVAARIQVPGVIMSERDSLGVSLVGISPEEEKGVSFLPESISYGRFLESPDDPGIIVGERLLTLLQTDIGKKVVLMSQSAQKELSERGFRVVGTFKSKLRSTEESYVFIGRNVAQNMLKAPDSISQISILLADKEEIETFTSFLSTRTGGLSVLSWEDINPFASAIIKLQSRFIGFLFLLVFVAVSFGVINTLLMSVFERTHEIGLIRAIGMKPIGVVMQVVFEATILTMIGSAIGNIASWATIHLLLNKGVDISLFAEGAEYFGAGKIIFPVVVRDDWITINIFVFLMGIISGLYPAWRASALKPVEALMHGFK